MYQLLPVAQSLTDEFLLAKQEVLDTYLPLNQKLKTKIEEAMAIEHRIYRIIIYMYDYIVFIIMKVLPNRDGTFFSSYRRATTR